MTKRRLRGIIPGWLSPRAEFAGNATPRKSIRFSEEIVQTGFSVPYFLASVFHYCANNPGKALGWGVAIFAIVTVLLFIKRAGK